MRTKQEAMTAGKQAYLSDIPKPIITVECHTYWHDFVDGWEKAKKAEDDRTEWRRNTTEEMKLAIESFEKDGIVMYTNKYGGSNPIKNPSWGFENNFYEPYVKPEKDIFANIYFKNEMYNLQTIEIGREYEMKLYFYNDTVNNKDLIGSLGQAFKLVKVE